MYAPDRSTGSAPPSPGGRNARYAYLVGRLHNRQMTMEEATELFTLMQSMIQTSEAARIALMRTPPSSMTPPPPPPTGTGAPTGPSATSSMVASDDLLLVGLLAMGAGAGLLAAMTKRIQDATPSPDPPARSRPNSVTASRKG